MIYVKYTLHVIAEFLKVYSFVKEYGEGVDRMYKELEAVGMQAPEYRLNAFMLQVTVWNKKATFGKEKDGLSVEKTTFGKEKDGLSVEKTTFEKESQVLSDEKAIEEYKNLLVKIIENAVKSKILTPRTSENIKKVVGNFQFRQIFGRKEIKEELGYGDSKAGKMIGLMQSLDIIVPVEGKGKGKYILKEFDHLIAKD